MKKRLAWALIPGLMSLLGPASYAGVTATIVDTVGDPHSVAVTAGGSFDIVIKVTTDTSLSALQLQVTNTSNAGSFTLGSPVTFSAFPGGVWSDSEGDQVDPTPVTLDAGNSWTSGTLGDLAHSLHLGTGTGTFDFASIPVTFNGPGVPGNAYYLSLSGIVYGDTNFDEFDGSAGQAYQVDVIPAPGALLLGMVGLGFIRWIKMRFAK